MTVLAVIYPLYTAYVVGLMKINPIYYRLVSLRLFEINVQLFLFICKAY